MKGDVLRGMLKLISGLNTTGKTRYLKWLYNKDRKNTSYIGYDNSKILMSKVRRDIEVEDNSDNRILLITELLSRSGDKILLDEIDSYVHPADKHILYRIIEEISKDAEIVAVTHDVEFTTYGDAYYSVTWSDGNPCVKQLSEEEYRKLV